MSARERLCLREVLHKSSSYLEQRRVDAPRLSAELIAAHALSMKRLELYLDLDRPLTEQELSFIRPLLARRGAGEPMAYILGRKEFYGLDFFVTRDVLIPRPETELGVDLARGFCLPDESVFLADVGTGAGALAVTLLVHLPMARCLATDISRAALDVARRNCRTHGVLERALLTQADLLSHAAAESLDVIAANLPYLAEAELATISHEVAGFEPRTALVAGPQGDELFTPLIKQAMSCLKPGGRLLLETGHAQAGMLVRAIQSSSPHWTGIVVSKDHAGIQRYVQARWSHFRVKQP